MQENTNKAIAVNSAILYGKTIINTLCALLTTRFALQALGVIDYGLYAVLGGIISFIGIFNTIMVATSNRFMAVAIGKGDIDEANQQFNVNLFIHVGIAFLALMVAFPVGEWYIPRYVNYDGSLDDAMMVYTVSIVGSILSFVGVPYNGLLMAKEKFIIFSIADVFSHLARLVVAWILVYHFEQKLLIYTFTMAIMLALPTAFYILYCAKRYPQIVRLRKVRDKQMYKRVFNFSSWVAVGAVAQVSRNQGAALIVNTFFNTAMNTAMGVATSVNAYVSLFAQNVTQPMAPQITKSYASGNHQRTDELLIMSAKYSFMLTFLIGSIFLVEPEWILRLWLGNVPQYASVFLILLVIDNLVKSLNSGISNIIFASGKISLFQALASSLNILSIILGYFALRLGAPAYFLIVAYIIVSIGMFFALQFALRHTLHYNNRKLWRYSYIPSVFTVILYLPVFFLPQFIHPIFVIILSFIYLCILEWTVCLSKAERQKMRVFIIETKKKLMTKK